MTAIAYRDGVLAADSVAWASTCVKVPSSPKIVRLPDGGLLAAAGETGEIRELREFMSKLVTSQPRMHPTFDKDEGLTALWVRPDRSLWRCWYQLRWYSVDAPFDCIGAPAQFMFGALHAGASAEEAVRLAVLHTDGAGGEVQVERL